MHAELTSQLATERILRERSRLCLLTASVLTVALSLALSAWPQSEFLRAVTWPGLACALTLFVVGRFVIGHGLDWSDRPNEQVTVRTRVHMMCMGSLLLALFVVGRFVFDRELARGGGVPGLARSMGLMIAGVLLVAWGMKRPSWLFLRDSEQPSADAGSVRWVAVFTGPAWLALSMQSLLDEAGFRTLVPDSTAVLTEEIILAHTVLVPEIEFRAARTAIETYEASAVPRPE